MSLARVKRTHEGGVTEHVDCASFVASLAVKKSVVLAVVSRCLQHIVAHVVHLLVFSNELL